MQFVYGFLFLIYLTFLPSNAGWAISLLWGMMILPLGDAHTTKVYTTTLEIENETTVVEFSKQDITGQKELVDAVLTVIDENDKVIDTWTSTEETHKIEGLVVGNIYTLREEIAPNGYVKATEIKFTIKNTAEVQKVTMIDKILEVVKTDFVTGKEVPGAGLKVVDEYDNIIDEWTSTEVPHIVVGLEEGKTYRLIETTAPYGYEITEEITFTVTEDKETQRIEMKDMPILKTIKILKIDEETKEVIKEKFTFGIYEDEACTKLIKEVKSDKKEGTVTFEGIRYGVVYLKELAAPKGYQLSNKIIKIEINDKGVFAEGELLQEDEAICTLEYTNKQIPKIQTGNETNYALLIGGVITSLLGIITGIVLLKRKKQENN